MLRPRNVCFWRASYVFFYKIPMCDCVSDFPESLLSLAIVVGIYLLRRVEGLSVLSLYMEVCYPVGQNLPKDGVILLSTPSRT